MLDRRGFIVKEVEILGFRFSKVFYDNRLESCTTLFSNVYLNVLLVLEVVFKALDKRLEVVGFVRLTKVVVIENECLIFKH